MRTLVLITILGLVTAIARAGELTPPTAPTLAVRASVERALPYLEKEGVKWHEDNSCLSCHHITLMTWSHLEARRRGLNVDPSKLKEWIGWCVDWAEPKGGDEVLAQVLTFLTRDVVPDQASRKKIESLPAVLLAKQKSDGHWEAAGQFRGERWPAREADEVATSQMLLALTSPWADPGKVAVTRQKTDIWLRQSAAPEGARTFIARLLLEHRLGDGARKESLVNELLSQQCADGGWSWKLGQPGSDPLATGEAMYVLGIAGGSAWTPALQRRAADSLVRSQQADGSWYQDHKRISARIRPDPKPRVDAIYSYYATGWATLGLLQLLQENPVADVGN